MNDSIANLLRKADMDLFSAAQLLSIDAEKYADKICADCQQAVEKWLKAAMFASDQKVTKTHELGALCRLLGTIDSAWLHFLPECIDLTPYLSLRYEGEIDEEHAREAMAAATRIGKFAESWIRARVDAG